MNCFAEYENGRLIAVSTGSGAHPITEDEYRLLLAQIREKETLVRRLYDGQIAPEDLPSEWREELEARVRARREAEAGLPDGE